MTPNFELVSAPGATGANTASEVHHQVGEILAQQRFAPGKPHLFNPKPHKNPH